MHILPVGVHPVLEDVVRERAAFASGALPSLQVCARYQVEQRSSKDRLWGPQAQPPALFVGKRKAPLTLFISGHAVAA